MNDDSGKRLQHQQQEQTSEQQQTQPQERVFETPEEMLQYDASQTKPPETIAARLKDSMANEPAPSRPWWKRIFSRNA